MSSKCIVGFGEVMLRLCPREFMRLKQVLPGALEATFGGGEANVCASLAMFGEKSRYATALPENPVSESFAAQMKSLGVGVDKIHYKKSGRMGIYFVETGANQRASNVVYDREGSVISQTGPDEYDYEGILGDAKWLHLSGITPALSEKAYLATLEFAAQAVKRGVPVSVDINFRKKLWNWGKGSTSKELAGKCMSEITALATLIIGNEEDAADVFGIHSSKSSAEKGVIDYSDYKDVAIKLASKFPKAKYIAITLRESLSATHNKWGAMLFEADSGKASYGPLNENGDYSPYDIANIVDRVGGGDSFAAGQIYGLNTPDRCAPAKA
jgi:2-dehydro-3-deoxygluconokinase